MVTGVYNAVNEIVTVSQSAITVEPLGYIPKLRRTNLNMRTNSLMVDNRVLHTYNFSVALKPSVTVQTYIGANHTGIDALLPLIKIRNTAYAVQTFERLERSLQALDATRGLPVGSTYFASEHVVPYYRTHNITVTNVESLRSQDKELDIRSQIIAALRLMISTCLNDSNYKVALKLLLENENDFKVLIVTDPVLYSFIWESGDDRTLGDNVDYSIVNSINPFFKDKIYFTFTTNSRAKQLHQLNFGCHPVAPYIVQQSTVPRNGVLLNEISVIPREDFFVFLPILGRINILDMGKLFVDPFIDSVGDLVNANNANTSNI
jgi:hypothetical protein